MLRAEELRIGNYINVPRKDQIPFRIDIIEFASENNIKVSMNIHKFPHPFNEKEFINAHPIAWEMKDLKPIELTEDILLKCGFVFNGWNYDHGIFVLHFQSKDAKGVLINTEFGIRREKKICVISFQIKYLHQLQNLYFTLTGKELEVKL